MTDRLELRFTLACSPAHAFRVFTEMVELWWPRSHRRLPEGEMAFEPGPDGRLVERIGSEERTVGDVVAWQPPGRLSFDWWLGANEHPTRVDIAFRPTEAGTAIDIVHTPGDALVDDIFADRVARFEQGWNAVFGALSNFLKQQGSPPS